jgi:hypothetical protein
MAKPIFIVRCDIPKERIDEVHKALVNHLKNEYHVILVYGEQYKEHSFMCFNPENEETINQHELNKIINGTT